ncbi:MAG: LysM peptidoglycan-binding domain-containing protein [Ilumatobacteraceae bacterium]
MTRTIRVVLTAGLALALAVPMSAAVAEAAPATGGSSAVTTEATTTTVRAGDSLAGIAHRFGVRLSTLLRANSMTLTSVIHPGDTIVIPAGASLPASTSRAASTRTTGGSAGSATTSAYVVQPGDALAGIAWRNGVTLRALVEANGLTVASVIFPGQTLSVPPATRAVSGTTSTSATRASTPAPTTGTAAASTSAYVVQPGDALAGIAWRNGVTLRALVEANGLTVASVIFPGQTLSVPPATRAVSRTTSTSATPARTTGAPVGSAASGSVDTLLAYLREQIGKPYEFFSAGPETFDCSGLVVAGFRQLGVSVPHQSRALARLGTEIDWRAAPIVAGDLVFTSAVNDPALITHVGVALDSRTWIHAVGRGRTVSVGSLPSTDRIMAVRRLPLP